jgi:hypothetical protein
MILEPLYSHPSSSVLNISDAIIDIAIPWATIGNCLPGVWLAKKTIQGLVVCHENHLDPKDYRDWIFSHRDVGIDHNLVMVSYDFTLKYINEVAKLGENVKEEKWTNVDYAICASENGYLDVHLKYNEDTKVVGIWIETL